MSVVDEPDVRICRRCRVTWLSGDSAAVVAHAKEHFQRWGRWSGKGRRLAREAADAFLAAGGGADG